MTGRWAGLAGLGYLALGLLLIGLDRHFPPALTSPPQVSAMVADRHGVPLRAFAVEDGVWRLKADLDATDPAFVEALIAYEDQRFWHHGGVDPFGVVRALRDAVRAGRIVSGASTITMQTVRLSESRPRTLRSKLMEMVRAVQLEARHDKRAILEWYLTLAPYGGNLEGVRAASLAYFGREPLALSPAEIALLVALPQSPEARRPDLRPQVAAAARARVADRLYAAGIFDAEERALAKDARIPERRDFPAMAWHAAETVRDLARHDRSQPAATLRSTLDAHWQAELEAMAATYADSEGPDVHVTLMVIENRSRAVRALVGSAGRERPGGWIDLTDRLRSPGSTLKPFIYGLAMDEGSADLFTVLSDAPHRFSDYAPNNFDRTFRGEVRLADALGYSLNVPAVHALDRIGPDRFIAALDQAGTRPVVRRAREDGRVGLAVALGGLGFTARDLAVLYAGLDEGGIMRPLQWFEADAKPPEVARLLGADTAARLVRAMREAPAPPGFAPAQLLQARDAVAFKTGTSYGFRDAWAVGLADGHTVVVWVGRADARPRPGTTGRQTAAPILFDVFARIARMRQDTRAGPVLEGPRGDAVARFTGEAAPHILFPPEDATIILDRTSNHGFVLAAQGSGPFTWYVDGSPVPRDAARQSVWRPQGGGFYRLEVVDAHGRTSSLKVRVKATS